MPRNSYLPIEEMGHYSQEGGDEANLKFKALNYKYLGLFNVVVVIFNRRGCHFRPRRWPTLRPLRLHNRPPELV